MFQLRYALLCYSVVKKKTCKYCFAYAHSSNFSKSIGHWLIHFLSVSILVRSLYQNGEKMLSITIPTRTKIISFISCIQSFCGVLNKYKKPIKNIFSELFFISTPKNAFFIYKRASLEENSRGLSDINLPLLFII